MHLQTHFVASMLPCFTFFCCYIVLCMQFEALDVVGLTDIMAKHLLVPGVILFF
jgi:hypothetical protein